MAAGGRHAHGPTVPGVTSTGLAKENGAVDPRRLGTALEIENMGVAILIDAPRNVRVLDPIQFSGRTALMKATLPGLCSLLYRGQVKMANTPDPAKVRALRSEAERYRRLGRSLSLRADQELLFKHARELDAEADALERPSTAPPARTSMSMQTQPQTQVQQAADTPKQEDDDSDNSKT